MQLRTLTLLIILLPILACNGAYLWNVLEGAVEGCIPYLEGCTSISRAARSGSALIPFKIVMMTYGLLLILFWWRIKYWVLQLNAAARCSAIRSAKSILRLGIVGAIALLVYIVFLGTDGEINRFMRRIGILFYFMLTPLAQLILLNQHVKQAETERQLLYKHRKIFQWQKYGLLLLLLMAIFSIVMDATGWKTDMSEYILEWNFALLFTLYFVGMLPVWKRS